MGGKIMITLTMKNSRDKAVVLMLSLFLATAIFSSTGKASSSPTSITTKTESSPQKMQGEGTLPSISKDTLQINYVRNGELESILNGLKEQYKKQDILGVKSVVIDVNTANGMLGDEIAEGSDWDLIFSLDKFFPNVSNLTINSLAEVPDYGLYRIIGANAMGPNWLVNLSLPHTEKVGAYAFTYSSNLKSVNLPSVVEIERDAFHACSALTNVNSPKILIVGESAFKETSVQDVHLTAF